MPAWIGILPLADPGGGGGADVENRDGRQEVDVARALEFQFYCLFECSEESGIARSRLGLG
jgi:hypothetical protein